MNSPSSTDSMALSRPVGRNVGEEAQAPEVHAHQRHAALGHEPRGGDERAVAAHHDAEVRARGELRQLGNGVGLGARGAGGRLVHGDGDATPVQHARQLVEHFRKVRRVAFSDDGDRLERRGHGAN
jgi:hypothetical protein